MSSQTSPTDTDQHKLAARARALEIRASRQVSTLFAGEYASAFRGRGIEFDQVDEYTPGDDVRCIDWNVTARLGRPFTKRFIEERELTVVMVIDRTASMDYGTVRATKLETAIEVCSLLALAAGRSHDRTALASLEAGTLRYLPAGKGRRHTQRLLSESVRPQAPAMKVAGMGEALEHLDRMLRARAVICLCSDFIEPLPMWPLSSLASRHEVIAVSLSDPAELELPEIGMVTMRDPETGRISHLDTGDPGTRQSFRELARERVAERRQAICRCGAEYLHLQTGRSPLHPLMLFFRDRGRRRIS